MAQQKSRNFLFMLFAMLYFVQGVITSYQLNFLKPHMASEGIEPDRLAILATLALLPFIIKFLYGLILRQLLRPRLAEALLNNTGERLKPFFPLLRNTVSPTIVRGGEKINVIPCEITLDLDGRMLPGFTPEIMVKEVQAIVGQDIKVEVLEYDPPDDGRLDMTLFNMLTGVLRTLDPDGVPLPYMLPAVSDARFFARLDIQHYGFTPLNLPPDFNFMATVHAADERVPVEALQFGTEAMFMALQRYGRS